MFNVSQSLTWSVHGMRCFTCWSGAEFSGSESLFFISIFRIAVFSVTVLHDERIVVIAEQRPDSTEEDSFQWMSRVLQVFVLFIPILADRFGQRRLAIPVQSDGSHLNCYITPVTIQTELDLTTADLRTFCQHFTSLYRHVKITRRTQAHRLAFISTHPDGSIPLFCCRSLILQIWYFFLPLPEFPFGNLVLPEALVKVSGCIRSQLAASSRLLANSIFKPHLTIQYVSFCRR